MQEAKRRTQKAGTAVWPASAPERDSGGVRARAGGLGGAACAVARRRVAESEGRKRSRDSSRRLEKQVGWGSVVSTVCAAAVSTREGAARRRCLGPWVAKGHREKATPERSRGARQGKPREAQRWQIWLVANSAATGVCRPTREDAANARGEACRDLRKARRSSHRKKHQEGHPL
ncbi:hypothetical protein TRVL_08391 [Trypanosoma vivax]|nr:hypothetical protein TRVL_08391 [Trypanosoma vivax]